MAGKYLIGIDNGTQSAKVVDLRPRGQRGVRGEADAPPHGAPQAGVRRASRRRPLGVHRRGEPRGDDEVHRRPGGHPRRRPVHHPLLQGLPQGRRLAARARHELDGHARLPALDPGRPRARLRDHLVRLHDPPLHRRVPRQRRQQHHPAVAHRHRHVAVGPGAVRAVQHAPGAARRAADAGRHRRLRDRRRGGGDRHPGGPAGRHHRQRQGGRGARLRLARRAHGARLAGHLHRLHGARPREPPGRRGLLDELRLRPRHVSLRERRRAPRHVDPQLVPRPARARARRGGGEPGASRARSTSSARPSWSPPGAAAS